MKQKSVERCNFSCSDGTCDTPEYFIMQNEFLKNNIYASQSVFVNNFVTTVAWARR